MPLIVDEPPPEVCLANRTVGNAARSTRLDDAQPVATTLPSAHMTYKQFGHLGRNLTQVIIGCTGLGSPEWQSWVGPEERALPLLRHAYDCGTNTWDTAFIYSNRRSEEIVGMAIQLYDIPRTSVVILSKCYFSPDISGAQPWTGSRNKNDGPLVNMIGLLRKHILDAVEASVKRLGTYIDVLQIH